MSLDILCVWYPEDDKFQKWWFRGKIIDDETIAKKTLIRKCIEYIQTTFKSEDIHFWKQTPTNCFKGILYYDQFFRHLQENTEEHQKMALELCFYGIQQNWIPIQPHFLVFFLMPLRHTKNFHYVNYCISYVKNQKAIREWDCKKQLEINSKYFERFLKAATKTKITTDIFKTDISWLSWIDNYRDILCNEVTYIYHHSHEWLTKSTIWRCFIDFINRRELHMGKKTLIISLSGGVDSMVFLYLCQFYKKINIKFLFGAVHLNWNQREESSREAQFLQEYLNRNDISSINQNVTHISREKDRLHFETTAREIRFELYRKAIREWNGDCVFLGHHRGDVVENVFLNMMNGNHFLDLAKMSEESIMDSVLIVRPFLTIDKADIYEVAKKELIPFFKNTTPTWSNRGVLRNTIFPSMYRQFGKGFEKGLLSTAKKSKEMGELLDCLLKPYLKKIEQISENEYRLPFESEYPSIFYESMLEQFMYSHEKQKIRKKSFESWYNHAFKTTEKGWKPFTLSKTCQIILEDSMETMLIKFT